MARPLPLPLLLVTIALVLAGCGAPSTPSGPSETAGTTTPASTPDGALGGLPPGLTADGVVNTSRLAAARTEALTGQRYGERARTTLRVDGETLIERRTVSEHGDAHRLVTRYARSDRAVRTGELSEGIEWTNGTVTVRRARERDGDVTYTSLDRGAGVLTRPQGGYVEALASGGTLDVSSQPDSNGTTRYTLVATGPSATGPWGVYTDPPVEFRGPGGAEATVTESGVITRFSAEFPVRYDGRNGTLRHTYRLGDDPGTVERPLWFAEALAND